jgi:hypothetical protein
MLLRESQPMARLMARGGRANVDFYASLGCDVPVVLWLYFYVDVRARGGRFSGSKDISLCCGLSTTGN